MHFVRAGVQIGLAAFLAVRMYGQTAYIPTPDAWHRAETANDVIAHLQGGVIAPRHPFLPIQDGHNNRQYSEMPYQDAMWAGFSGLQLGSYLDGTRADWALVTGTEYTAADLVTRYQLHGVVPLAPAMVIGEASTLRYLLKAQDSESDAEVLFDFEHDEGWEKSGDAFEASPTSVRPRSQRAIAGVVGDGLADSYHPVLGDAATGTLTSPPFVIDRPRMALRVGGGWTGRTRVELRVDERVIYRASGLFQNQEALIRVVWDLSAFQGNMGQVVIVDQDTGYWGHVLCDRIVLY